MWRARFIDRRRAARQNQPARTAAAQLVNRSVEGNDFGIDAKLAHAPRDQLRVLSAEVEDENRFMFVAHKALKQDYTSAAAPSAKRVPSRLRGIRPSLSVSPALSPSARQSLCRCGGRGF